MVKQVITFQTSDGKKFDNEADAAGHEKAITAGASIEAYLTAAGVDLKKAGAGAARRHVANYLAFMDTYSPEGMQA